jgi:precorrin-3B synthase
VAALRARPSPRTRNDRCPGALRPWQAADGLLVRLRLIGGRVTSASLTALLNVAEEYGDGRVYVTVRANLQVRAFPGCEGTLAPEALAAIEATGLLPTRSHELVRNIMCSPQTGLVGGRMDVRRAATELDARLCAEERLSGLPGKFLFVLDDGRGDLIGHRCDLGLAALDGDEVQLRLGDAWGPVVPIGQAPLHIAALTGEFLLHRGSGPAAPWHVAELPVPLLPQVPADARLPKRGEPLPYGLVPRGRHVAVSDSGLDRAAVADLTAGVPEVIVTPWRGVLVPEETSR